MGPVGDLEGVCRSANAEDRASPLQVVHHVLHLFGGKVLKTQTQDQQIGRSECFEARHLRASGLDEAVVVQREKDAGLEAEVAGEQASHRGQDFFRAILVIPRDQDDMFAHAGSLGALVDHEVGIGVLCGTRESPCRW